MVPNKKELGSVFKKEGKAVQAALEALCEEDALCMKGDLDAGKPHKLSVGGKEVEITPAMASVTKETKRVAGR